MALGKVGVVCTVNAQSLSYQSVYFQKGFFCNTLKNQVGMGGTFLFNGDDQYVCMFQPIEKVGKRGKKGQN